MRNKVVFPIGQRFIAEVLPVNGNRVEFSIEPLKEAAPIEIGSFEKGAESIIQNIKIESVLDTIPCGKFRVLLAKMEESE
jgi:hypothetical protein